ncbi:MAG: glutamine synthetase III [Bacillota bacterium]
MSSLTEIFGSNVFNDAVMKERLPKATYKEIKKTIEQGESLAPATAEVVANAMKDWAIEKGATHFAHWFQPMTGAAAGKHDSFINPTDDGKVILEFSGKELIKGEPDASSFPSGGLRATFEARGYTAWDCTSPAFLIDETLYIPTAFCSYTGEALDKKTPVLRSMEAMNVAAMKLLKVLGDTTTLRVVTTSGPEQEYFLVDKDVYLERKDLRFTGRTLFGARTPKGQEMEDHYFGSIKERIFDFMKELDTELWKLGVAAKTKHNEVAPSQYEIAPVFTTANIATDHNQLVMETLRKVALRHDMVCLLHEKPFAGINGSGKHNNWSLATNDGKNLLEPGKNPEENVSFLLFLSAVIKAVDDYADLLRLSAANPGNDHRLGANEAPPAIISIFLGDHLVEILESIEMSTKLGPNARKSEISVGVKTLPVLAKDTTDRNRTSSFAFTGNKFEFRMVPSSASIAGSCFVLNTIVAETITQIAEKLAKAKDVNKEAMKVIAELFAKHKRVIYNGNGYTDEWIEEAARRGLPNITNMVDATKAIISKKNVDVLKKHGVLDKNECESRYEILLEQYSKTIMIEALTALDMGRKQILPSVLSFQGSLAGNISTMIDIKKTSATATASKLFDKLSKDIDELSAALDKLESAIEKVEAHEADTFKHASKFRDLVCPAMLAVREVADSLELYVDEEFWPFPTYGDIFFETI